MMTKTRLFLHLSLLAFLFAACAPSAATESSVEPMQPTVPLPVVQSTATLGAEIPSPTLEAAATQTLAPTAIPVATSRGPNLEATDPLTVSLASGQIQFVEFFRFT